MPRRFWTSVASLCSSSTKDVLLFPAKGGGDKGPFCYVTLIQVLDWLAGLFAKLRKSYGS
jgi:hypothetical protein